MVVLVLVSVLVYHTTTPLSTDPPPPRLENSSPRSGVKERDTIANTTTTAIITSGGLSISISIAVITSISISLTITISMRMHAVREVGATYCAPYLPPSRLSGARVALAGIPCG